MDARTLEALRLSITHWEENLAAAKAGEEFSIYDTECALCAEFAKESTTVRGNYTTVCHGCPVKESSGKHCCQGTPWNRVRNLMPGKGFHSGDLNLISAVEAELNFLRSLLPPENTHDEG